MPLTPRLFRFDAAAVKTTTASVSTTAALAAKTSALRDALELDKAAIAGVIAGTLAPVPVPTPAPTAGDIAEDSALGKVRETIALGKRLETSPSVEFRNIASSAKQRFFTEGVDILMRAGIALEDIPVRGYAIALRTPASPPRKTIPIEDVVELRKRLAGQQPAEYELRNQDGALLDSTKIEVIDLENQPIDQGDLHEATYFTRGLDSIDSVVYFLRNVESRIDDYRRLQNDAKAARSRHERCTMSTHRRAPIEEHPHVETAIQEIPCPVRRS